MSTAQVLACLKELQERVRAGREDVDLAKARISGARASFDTATLAAHDPSAADVAHALAHAEADITSLSSGLRLLDAHIDAFTASLAGIADGATPTVPDATDPHYRVDTPVGFTDHRFKEFARKIRQLVKHSGLPDGELVVQGSRVRRTARVDADIDIALRVDGDAFFQVAESALARTHLGTKLRESMLDRIRHNGQLSSFDLGKDFIALRKELVDSHFPYKVQFSVLRKGGRLDTPPYRRINRGNNRDR